MEGREYDDDVRKRERKRKKGGGEGVFMCSKPGRGGATRCVFLRLQRPCHREAIHEICDASAGECLVDE